MPGKPRYTQEVMIAALEASMGLIGPAARSLGCDYGTVENYIKKYPRVGAARAQQRNYMLDLGEASLVRAVRQGEGWAVCFLLKTQGKDRGYVERVEQKIELEVYVRERAKELGLTPEEAMEVLGPRMLKTG